MERKADSVCIAALSRDEEEQKAIADDLGACGASSLHAASLHRLREILFEQPCNGLLFSVSSLVGLDASGKSLIQLLEQVYPAVRIRWGKDKKSYGLFAARIRRVESLAEFAMFCSKFVPRCLRRTERLSRTLNVLLSAAPDMADSTRTFTMNISMRGCFLHTTREWETGSSVYLQIMELPGRRVIEAKVIRYVPWGTPFRAQGIGIQFINLQSDSSDELQRLLFYLPVARSEKASP